MQTTSALICQRFVWLKHSNLRTQVHSIRALSPWEVGQGSSCNAPCAAKSGFLLCDMLQPKGSYSRCWIFMSVRQGSAHLQDTGCNSAKEKGEKEMWLEGGWNISHGFASLQRAEGNQSQGAARPFLSLGCSWKGVQLVVHVWALNCSCYHSCAC